MVRVINFRLKLMCKLKCVSVGVNFTLWSYESELVAQLRVEQTHE